MAEIQDHENRRYKRLRADLEVKYENLAMSPEQLQRIEGVIDNISMGGVFIRTRHPFPINTIMKLEFDIPDQNKTVKAVGMVRWIGKSDEARGMGIKFIKVTTVDKEHLTTYIEKRKIESGEYPVATEAPPPVKPKKVEEPVAVSKENPSELFKRIPYNGSIQRVMGFYIGEIDSVFSASEIAAKAHVDELWLTGVWQIFVDAGIFQTEGEKVRFINPVSEETWRKLVEWAVEFVAVGEDTSGRYDRFFRK